MHWQRTLQLVDVHCGGEIGRVVTGGLLNIPGQTMADKLAHINTVDDSLRRLLCSEPRSGPAGSVVLLLPATRPEADVGFIVLQPDQAHAMSGSNAMCAVTALLETGMKPMTEPESVVTLDTAAGLVQAVAHCKNGKVLQVTLHMPAAFVAQANQVIESTYGTIRYDLCFGGVFYALIQAAQINVDIKPENARQLAETGVALRDQIAAQVQLSHPEIPQINELAYVMFYSDQADGSVRTCTTLKPGRVDRSPCGTGSNSNMALRYSQQRVQLGETITSHSIIGSQFSTQLLATTQVGPFAAIKTQVSGQCWIYGITQMGLDPTDPFQHGFMLSDTWGQLLEQTT
jgi:proline racemase